MYEIWKCDDPVTQLAETLTFIEALAQVDVQCRRYYDEVLAGAKGARQVRTIEIRHDGDVVGVVSYTPDISRPYESVNA